MDETNELLEYIYEDCEMATITLTKLLEELQGKDNKIKKVVEDILKEYEKYLKESKKILKEHKIKPKKVSFMDSAGIGLIIGRYKQTNCFGGKLEVVNVNSKIRKVFEMSGILNIIPILDDFEVEKIS